MLLGMLLSSFEKANCGLLAWWYPFPMPDCDSVPIQTVRVYLKRLPSGALRLTVLSPSLPRPVFRMYPADVGEAEAVARAVGRALSIRVNAEQSDQRNNAEAEHKVHALPASGVDGCGHHGPEEAHHRHGQPEDRLVAVEVNEATQHRRPPLRLRVLWQGLL